MKKRLFFAAMAAIALSSCSKNQVTEVLNPSDNINSIGLSAATSVTRGTETTTAIVETSNDLVLTFCGKDATDGSEVKGNLDMVYNASKDAWDQKVLASDPTSAKLWSSLELPASFYSMHAGSEPITANASTLDAATFAAYTPAEAIVDQKDLVCYAGSISAMPLAGYIRGDFNHALSRVEIYSNQGDYVPSVKTVDFMNLKKSGAATLAIAGTCTWDVTAATATSYNYYKAATGSALVATQGDFVSETATAYEAKNMIIIPQALENASTIITTLDGSSDPVVETAAGYADEAKKVMETSAFAGITASYVKALYRMKDASTADVAGYNTAKDSKAYQSMKAALAAGDPTAKPILPATITDDSELYVLAGFPFVDGQTFDVNKDYDVYLGFGANGGFLLYDYYFDADGNPTNIKVHGIETNDPIINPDAPIGIMVNVTEWKQGTATTVEK